MRLDAVKAAKSEGASLDAARVEVWEKLMVPCRGFFAAGALADDVKALGSLRVRTEVEGATAGAMSPSLSEISTMSSFASGMALDACRNQSIYFAYLAGSWSHH